MSTQPPRNNDSDSGNGNEQDTPRNYVYINPRIFPEIASGDHIYPPVAANLTTAQWLRQVEESRNRPGNSYSIRPRHTYSSSRAASQASWPYPRPAPGYAQNSSPAPGHYPPNPPRAPGYYTTPSTRQLVLRPAANSYTAASSSATQSSRSRSSLPTLAHRPKPTRPRATTSRPPIVPPHNLVFPEWIATADELRDLLSRLSVSTTFPPDLYFDIHGENLSRNGHISFITIYDRSLEKVYFIDVGVMGLETFTTYVNVKVTDRDGDIEMKDESVEDKESKPLRTRFVSLPAILQSEEIPKVFFDVRNDADVLFSLYDIKLGGVHDLQLMELATRHTSTPRTHLHSLLTCILTTLPLPPLQKTHLRSLKSTALLIFAPSLGGSYEALHRRPLSPTLERYCVQDVVHMPALWIAYDAKLWLPFWKFVVGRETKGRLEASTKFDYEPRGEGKGVGWGVEFLREMEGEFNGRAVDESPIGMPVGRRVRVLQEMKVEGEDDL
ncbi:hypothetical protein GRF29_103g400267 [Pseudopithomyces chartarum]|uniref:3'-5' exonuclease domain-containing protein n=1 Tax=Pseudopithomyces chartarum TaxID=1892770 RepID=A0AAN6LTP8_9PLEO|nr:hypothetical protein GRF29_103g400267 [Pseudopithomyces chartarum]